MPAAFLGRATVAGGQTVLSLAMVLGAGVTILIAPFVVAHL
jgi:hypothetical protein